MPRLALVGNDAVIFLDYRDNPTLEKQIWRYFNECGEHQTEEECYRCESIYLDCNHTGHDRCRHCGFMLRIPGFFHYDTRVAAYHSWNPCLFPDRQTDEKIISILKECGYMPKQLTRCLCCGGINYVDQENGCRFHKDSPHDEETKANIFNFLRNSGWVPGQAVEKDLHKAAIYSVLKLGYNAAGPQPTRPEVASLMKIVETADYVPGEEVKK